MSTTQDIVNASFRIINAIDINEASASPAEVTEGIRRLNAMISSWAGRGLAVTEHTVAGDLVSGEPTVTVEDTSTLAPGLNISGTGIPASTRILSVDSPTQFTMNADATASGTAVAIAVTPIPFEAKHEQGVIALLAQRLAVSAEDVPAWVLEDARNGWGALCAQFMVIPAAQFDEGLIFTTNTSRLGQTIIG